MQVFPSAATVCTHSHIYTKPRLDIRQTQTRNQTQTTSAPTHIYKPSLRYKANAQNRNQTQTKQAPTPRGLRTQSLNQTHAITRRFHNATPNITHPNNHFQRGPRARPPPARPAPCNWPLYQVGSINWNFRSQ